MFSEINYFNKGPMGHIAFQRQQTTPPPPPNMFPTMYFSSHLKLQIKNMLFSFKTFSLKLGFISNFSYKV